MNSKFSGKNLTDISEIMPGITVHWSQSILRN